MKLNKLFIFLILNIFLINFISAGLVIDPSSINVNKTYNEEKYIDLVIKNTELFPFYNIKFKDNLYLSMPVINEIAPGTNISVQAKVISNENNNVNLELIGFYNGSVGVSNIVYDYSLIKNDLSLCYSDTFLKEYNLIIGDSLKINNLDPAPLKLYQGENLIATITQNSFYSIQNLNTNVDYIYRLEYPSHISSVTGYHCNINVRISGDTDLINREEYNGNLNLNLKTYYEKTILSYTFPETSYSTDFFNTQEGFFSIKNEGSFAAKDVAIISNDWFSFSHNIFDIEPGQVKLVSYYIKPKIFNTSETNKTYNINVKVNGNFDEYNQNFSVFINYAEVSSDYIDNEEGLIDILIKYCSENPSVSFCNMDKRIVYKYVNNSDMPVNVTMTNRQIREWIQMQLDLDAFLKEVNLFYKEQINNLTEGINNANINSFSTSSSVDELSKRVDKQNDIILALLAFMGGFILVVILIIIIYFKYREKKRNQTEKV